MMARLKLHHLLVLALPTLFLIVGCEGAFNYRKRYTGKFECIYQTMYWTQATGPFYQDETLDGTIKLGEERDLLVLNVTQLPDNIYLEFTLNEGDSIMVGNDQDYAGRFTGKDEIVFDGIPVHAYLEYNNRLTSAKRK